MFCINFNRPWLIGIVLVLLYGCEPSPPALSPLGDNARILAFGDSLTYGTGAAHNESYPAILQSLLGIKVINAGIPGEISAKGLKRLPLLLKQHQPDLVIICHGGNDILRRYNLAQTRNNLQKMIDMVKTNNTQVIMVSVPQFGIFPSAPPLYSELASSNQLHIENDVLSDILRNNAMKSDQVHPNSKGYQLLAKRIHELIQQSGAI